MGFRFSGVSGGTRQIYETQGRASRLPITLERMLPGRGYLKNGWKWWDMPVGGYTQGPGGILVPKRITNVQTAPATGLTIQTGTSTVNTGVAGAGWASNTVLIGKALDTWGWAGKRVSLQRTNRAIGSRDITGWSVGSLVVTTPNASNGPDGNLLADRSDVQATGYSRYRNVGALTGIYTGSLWSIYVSGTQVQRSLFEPPTGVYFDGYAGLVWHRSNTTKTMTGGTGYLTPVTCVGSTARAYDTDMHQVELGQHPDEFIPTLAAIITRAGSADYYGGSGCDIGDLLTSGRIALEILVRAAGASTEYLTDGAYIYLWYRDMGTFVRMNTTTYRLEISVLGSIWSPAEVLVWSRYDELRFFIEMGGGVLRSTCKLLVNESTAPVLHDLGDSGGPQGWIAAGAPLYVLNREGTGQFAGWLGEFLAWEPLL
jgi:hypothetical protein